MKTRLFFILIFISHLCSAQLRLTEETITLPTYPTKAPDKNPVFYIPEESQLAERHIYPYPFTEVGSSEKKIDKQYKALILENEYLKVCVTPEMGGRIYYALDKTDGYNIVYYNHAVKPALIGMTGAWTSGGTEWNTPHHHRATSFLPVDYTLCDNEDGSKTIWVGEYEKRSQTRWLVGLTLEPGKAYLKTEFKNLDVTPYQYPALFFSNNAVHVNDDYQFIFPPDVEIVNFHYMVEFAHWPVFNQVYQSHDYTHGEDLSWWNATKQPVSFFVYKTDQDFLGGIDHGKKAGIVMVGNHQIFKGKKIWNWGKNEQQRIWDKKLTDSDGPYAELMVGFYSDNQPDYNFLAPFETKYGTLYMSGIKNLDGIKEANKDLIINLEFKDQKALIEANATSVQNGVKVVLSANGETLFQEKTDISPVKPYQKSVPVTKPVKYEDLKISVLSGNGKELISWQKQPEKNEPLPEPYSDPLDPKEIETNDDLFFAGLKIEQFGNTNFDYMKYYEEALSRDPYDVKVNTQIGLVYLKRGYYEKAEEHLKRAVEKTTGNYKKAQDATSLYYLGVCYMNEGRIKEALDMLYRSTWAYAWTSAGYTLVAKLESSLNNWEKASDAVERAYNANTQNIEALTTKTIVLRHLAKLQEAVSTAKAALKVDPLSFVAINEMRLLSSDVSTGKTTSEWLSCLLEHMRDEPYNFIETATRYSQMGLYAEAADIMSFAAKSDKAKLSQSPMVLYTMGMYLALAGEQEKSEQVLKQAGNLSIDYCFPYGEESVKALKFAISKNSNDATACYLLGNALCNFKPEKSVEYWEMAAKKMDKEAIIYRNIAYAEANYLKNMPKALDNIYKAISLDPEETRYYREANMYMSYAGMTLQQLEDFYVQHQSLVAGNIELQLLGVKISNMSGQYDNAINLMEKMRYHEEEGSKFNPHVLWFDANLSKGIELMNNKKYADAEKSFLKAMEFPANLEINRDGKTGIAYYYLGLCSKLSGNKGKAKAYFNKMVNYSYAEGWGAGVFPELAYFKALAKSELGGDKAEIAKIFEKLITDSSSYEAPVKDSRHVTVNVDESHSARTFLIRQEIYRKSLKVSSFYLQGLGYSGLGEKEKARSFFEEALKTDPMDFDSHLMLKVLR